MSTGRSVPNNIITPNTFDNQTVNRVKCWERERDLVIHVNWITIPWESSSSNYYSIAIIMVPPPQSPGRLSPRRIFPKIGTPLWSSHCNDPNRLLWISFTFRYTLKFYYIKNIYHHTSNYLKINKFYNQPFESSI